MPFANFKSVRGVSSEDIKYPAQNLLTQTAKKWKTKTIGERVAYVILELDEPHTITGIDLGNEHSAFIEVLVSKTSCNPQDFTEILVTCSFMTLIESKNSTNANRVRCFSKDALVSTAVSEKWQFIKVICSQPFNKHTQYGISFIKVHISDTYIDNSKITAKEVRERNETSLSQLGKFKLREESPESDSESSTSLFKRWKSLELVSDKNNRPENKGSGKIYTSHNVTSKTDTENSKKLTRQVQTNPKNNESIKNEKLDRCLDRNRQELAFGNEEKVEDDYVQKKRKRLSETIELERKQLRFKNDKIVLQENKECVVNTTQEDPTKNKSLDSKTISDKKNKRDESVKNDDVKPRIFRAFNELLKGTVLVISGIQNPDRANLRDMALAMGAKYKADWDTGCTHLICAFKNTPKYKQVQGKGKIVTRGWIEDCHRERKNLPWRRYALDSNDLHQPESEEEVLDECVKSTGLTAVTDISKDFDINNGSYHPSASSRNTQISSISSGSDTEDEIRRVLENHSSHNKPKASEANIELRRSVFEVSTEEEDFLSKKAKVDTNLKSSKILKELTFFICEDTRSTERNRIEHLVKANGGLLAIEASNADYLVSNGKSKDKIDSKEGIFVKPEWIYECSDMETKVPIKKYLL